MHNSMILKAGKLIFELIQSFLRWTPI